MVFGIYGGPPPARLWQGTIPADSLQFSPHLPPTALNIADQPEGSIDQCLIAAPAGTIERHYVLAHALRALRPGATAIIWAANDRGGARLKKELTALGLQNITEASGDHARLIHGTCSPALSPAVAAAIAAGGLHYRADIGYWTQPGCSAGIGLTPAPSCCSATCLHCLAQGQILAVGSASLGCMCCKAPPSPP